MSIVDGWVLEGCSGAVGRNRPWVDQMDWMARSGGVVTGVPKRSPGRRTPAFARAEARSEQNCKIGYPLVGTSVRPGQAAIMWTVGTDGDEQPCGRARSVGGRCAH